MQECGTQWTIPRASYVWYGIVSRGGGDVVCRVNPVEYIYSILQSKLGRLLAFGFLLLPISPPLFPLFICFTYTKPVRF